MASIPESIEKPLVLLVLFRLLPKSLFSWSKTFFDKSKARSRRCQNSPLGFKQLTSLIFHFAKGFLAKNVLMTAQRDYGFTNSLYWFDWFQWLALVIQPLSPTSETSKTN
jgi:hypothetical protein